MTNALSMLGIFSDVQNEIEGKDYFVEKDGVKFAGTHLLLDLWGASNVIDPELIERALRDAAEAANATILHSHFHHFGPDGGVSGVLVLAESSHLDPHLAGAGLRRDRYFHVRRVQSVSLAARAEGCVRAEDHHAVRAAAGTDPVTEL